jgi:calcineurin-like phosphoesterase family protein
MSDFFTADTHFGHANIIRYCNRPQCNPDDYDQTGRFHNNFLKRTRAREMDKFLIERWNQTVSNLDEVYHMGDFCSGTTTDVIRYLRALNFKKLYFIWGNHDGNLQLVKGIISHYDDLKDRVVFLGDYVFKTINGQEIALLHYAMRVWDRSHYGSWHVYGHSHGNLPDDPNSRSIDVGIDCHNYKPIAFERLKELMLEKNFVPIDHHGRVEGGGTGQSKEDFLKSERRRRYLELKEEFKNERELE